MVQERKKSEEEEEGRRRERAMDIVNAAARIVYLFFSVMTVFLRPTLGWWGRGGTSDRRAVISDLVYLLLTERVPGMVTCAYVCAYAAMSDVEHTQSIHPPLK